MRCSLIAIALIGLVSGASAEEFEIPTLRGSSGYAPSPFVPAPPRFMRWSGFYAGAEAGYGSAHIDFREATNSLVAFVLRELALENEQHVSEWPVLGKTDTGAGSVGGFVGYNSQWDDVVLGFELNYGIARYAANAPSDPISRRTVAGGNVYDVTVTGNASMHINDMGTARLRAGYVFNNIMPWAMVGMAVGRADITRSATVFGEQNPPDDGTLCSQNPTCVPFFFSKSETRNNAFLYGWSVGGGVDALVLPNVFLRAEYEYVSFASVAGIRAFVNTGRIGAGFKF